jgi:hypothetical protein
MGGIEMAGHKVVVFQVYPFRVGQKIRIEGGQRSGDWEVIGISQRKVKLRCPISGRQFEWDRFCYFVEKRDNVDWPQKD